MRLSRFHGGRRRSIRRSAVAWLAPFTLGIAAVPRADGQTGSHTGGLTLRDVLDATRTHPVAEAADARVRGARGARTTASAFSNPMVSYDVENAPFPNGSPVRGMERENMTTATFPVADLLQRWPR